MLAHVHGPARRRNTNVGHIDLATAATGRTTVASHSRTSTVASSSSHTAVKTSARGTRVAEARLGLSILADIDESAHQVLITERRYGVLRLLPRCILNNATALSQRNTQSITVQLSI
jgi:hypothetical protein